MIHLEKNKQNLSQLLRELIQATLKAIYVRISHKIEYLQDVNLATLPRMVKFKELNISKFWILKVSYINHHWKILKNLIRSGIKI